VKAKATAEQGVALFHQQLNQEQYDQIYSQAGDDFRKASSHDEVVALFSAIHRKLGNVQSSDQTNFYLTAATWGTFVTLNYKTKFADSTAAENFVFQVRGNNAVLVGYHINSTALITR
jgi:hypothetical protein